jgi:uncharacterized phage protein gp47/JayE
MFGLNKDGFNRMRYADIIAEMNSRARSVFGSDVNLSEYSPLGMFFKVVAFSMAVIWQLAEYVYYGAYKDTAEGYQLDGVCQYIGITRKPASYATGTVTFTGTEGTVIPLQFLVSTGTYQFWTQQIATIPVGGTVDVPIRAIELGNTSNVLASTITTIVNPLRGVTAVTNTLGTTGGADVETDEALRARYNESISLGGASTTSAIEAELLQVQNVVAAVVTENVTMATVDGIPAKAFEAMVYGGTNSDIADAIYRTKAAGIQAFGDITVPITDDNGQVHNIGFSRVAEVPVYVHVTLTTDSELFPVAGMTTIETNIIKYIGGTDADTTKYYGLGLGDDVVYTKIIGICHSVAGVTDVTVTLSTDNITFTAANVAIATGEVAVTDYNKVVIS